MQIFVARFIFFLLFCFLLLLRKDFHFSSIFTLMVERAIKRKNYIGEALLRTRTLYQLFDFFAGGADASIFSAILLLLFQWLFFFRFEWMAVMEGDVNIFLSIKKCWVIWTETIFPFAIFTFVKSMKLIFTVYRCCYCYRFDSTLTNTICFSWLVGCVFFTFLPFPCSLPLFLCCRV